MPVQKKIPELEEWRHPECRDDEVFVGYWQKGEERPCSLPGARAGTRVFAVLRPDFELEGTDRVPMFASRQRLERAGHRILGTYALDGDVRVIYPKEPPPTMASPVHTCDGQLDLPLLV